MPQLTAPDYSSRGTRLPDGFRYSSDNNEEWLDADGLRAMADSLPPARRMLDTRSANPGAEA